MAHHSLERVLSSDQLPTLPEVAVKVIHIARQNEPDMQQLIATIRADGAIAGRILKFANSALFGLRRKPSSIESAVPLLGTTMIRTLVLGFSLSRLQTRSESLRPWFQQLWRESLVQACTAELLAERIPSLDPPTWFLGGLLQDIGRLAMLTTCGQDYVHDVLAANDGRSTVRRERDAFGFSHVDVSVGLCRRWNLDPALVESIAVHHQSIDHVLPSAEQSRRSLAAALITASCCAEYMQEVVRELTSARQDLEKLLILDFGLRPDEVFRLLADVHTRVNELAAGFSIDVVRIPSCETILARAQAALVDIAIQSHLARVTSGRITDVSAVTGSDNCDDSDVTDYGRWLDKTSGAYTREYLSRSLPMRLDCSHASNSATSFLCLTVLPGGRAQHDTELDPLLRQLAEVTRQNVRPSDEIIRYDQHQLVVMLPGVNMDLLNRVAEHIQTELADGSEHGPAFANVRVVSGGLVHLPTGTQSVNPRQVLQQIEALLATTVSADSGQFSMILMQGQDSRRVDSDMATAPA